MQLSIVILNYKTKELAHSCLQSIFKHSVSGDFEVLVVDNHSQDDSVAFLEERWGGNSQITFIQSFNNSGFGAGMNMGIAQAKGEFVLLLNTDIEILEHSINDMLSFMKENKKCAICGPQLVYPDGTIQDSYRRFPKLFDMFIKRTFLKNIFKKRMRDYLMWDIDNSQPQQVDWLVGATLMIRKEFLEIITGFDERFFLFLEDTDICRQAWKNNYSVFYFPKAKVKHHHKRLSGNNFFDAIFKITFYIHIASAYKYWNKWKKIDS